MISRIAWDNIDWLREGFFSQLKHFGGSSIAVDSFRPYLTRSWVKQLNPLEARQQLFADIEIWAVGIKKKHLFIRKKKKRWKESFQIARGGEHYNKHLWFLLRNHQNLYCLATHRKTIEELAVGAYAYCSLPSINANPVPDPRKENLEVHLTARKELLANRKKVFADFRRLLRLSKAFLLAEWVHNMIERAVANNDTEFFEVISRAIKKDLLAKSTKPAVEWSIVILLWFLGGRDYDKRRNFLHDLRQHGIVQDYIAETGFNAELRRFGLTKTYI